jgi:hypothetical protein
VSAVALLRFTDTSRFLAVLYYTAYKYFPNSKHAENLGSQGNSRKEVGLIGYMYIVWVNFVVA